jgi:hypothetical protein
MLARAVCAAAPMRPKPLMPMRTGPALAGAPLELMMSMNSGFSDAPPTRKPSMSAWPASSLALAPVTLPP